MAGNAPRPVLMVNQVTSPQFVRALIAVVLLAVLAALLVAGRDVPEVLIGLLGMVVGSYFEVPAADN